MESDFFGLIVWNPGQLIISALLTAAGVWLLNSAGASALKAIAGALVGGIGAFSILDSIYVQDWRWVNTLLLAAVVIVLGIALAKAAGFATTVIGVLLIVFTLSALDGLPIFNEIQLRGTLNDVWDSATDSWNRLFRDQAQPLGLRE